MGQKGFYLDMTTCIGCKTCQIACSDKNNLEAGTLFRKVYESEGGSYPQPWAYAFSLSCNHCAKPKCTENCPTGALSKRADGIVTHDKDKCIGCKLCTWSCPYGAPKYIEKRGKVGKCDFCADLLDKGENPACVDACLMRTLKFGELEDLKMMKDGTSDIKGLPDSGMTQPSFVITPTKEAKK
ncbi:DMSO/selenate family reductase complex B subunit [Desulfosporosinus youngiae]|uniref:DMSO reductase, iron-sulfur subunit n=1 Tax=Desulfosporosinus youngiae DSM 17734 TaxID=768710 RepID=H5Y2Y6_9FIRM|nr:DMSO/selenate family reductase complex B subunit [Desulfosporosinus youngiae]EHQ88543.1 DMSO reductase, iron-sulfur subunit [Desulfosporosinus youngiae DSM 17734]